jgi:hypothetical protein
VPGSSPRGREALKIAADVRRTQTPKKSSMGPLNLRRLTHSPSDGERDQGRGVPFIGRRAIRRLNPPSYVGGYKLYLDLKLFAFLK